MKRKTACRLFDARRFEKSCSFFGMADHGDNTAFAKCFVNSKEDHGLDGNHDDVFE